MCKNLHRGAHPGRDGTFCVTPKAVSINILRESLWEFG